MITKYFGSGPQNEKRSQNRDTQFFLSQIYAYDEKNNITL